MSRENVEIARASIEAYNRMDWDGALKDASPDFECDLSRAVGPQHDVYRLDQMRRFWSEFAESWESVRIEPHEFIEAGEHVVVPLTMHTRGRDGIEVQARITWTWTILDGDLVRLCMYQDRQEAIEAVGLSEQDAHTDS
jgi:ketosteroid isomerase-like protein